MQAQQNIKTNKFLFILYFWAG